LLPDIWFETHPHAAGKRAAPLEGAAWLSDNLAVWRTVTGGLRIFGKLHSAIQILSYFSASRRPDHAKFQVSALIKPTPLQNIVR
jgi:hypothetical protein